MMSKIAGFILSSDPKDYIPKLNPEIKRKIIKGSWGYLVLYSMSEDIKQTDENVWSLGFPPHKSLLHHNLLITLKEDEVLIENDWIGGIPVYYNSKKKIVSTFPDICMPVDPKFDEEGLYLFLKYGFSAFGTTPFADIHTLRYYSSLKYKSEGINITEKEDPALSIDLTRPAKEDSIWELLREDISGVLDATSGIIISPLSGGLDSRIINALIPENHKSKVRTYSYGISPDQEKSFEALIAKRVATTLNLHWEQIILKDAYDFMDEWHDLFGFGTHLHGMFHIEFYKKILEKISPATDPVLFSGISGSAFQGGYPPKGYISSPTRLYDLALTHQLNCQRMIPEKETNAEVKFFDQNRQLLTNLKWYPVLTMRIKMNLLHYLYKLPAAMGISSTSPYHNFETAAKMLSLPADRRANRRWVNDFFRQKNIYFGNRIRYGDTRNTLDRQLFLNHKFVPLDEKLWEHLPVSPDLVAFINKMLSRVGTPIDNMLSFMTTQRIIKELLKVAGVKNTLSTYLPPYLTLKAVEKSLTKHQ